MHPNSLNPDPDTEPAFQMNPDPIRIQGFDDQNIKKLQEKPSALKREHPELKKMKFINFFSTFVGLFALLDPDPDCESRLRNRIRIRIQGTPIESRSRSTAPLRRRNIYSFMVYLVLYNAVLWIQRRNFSCPGMSCSPILAIPAAAAGTCI